METARVALVPFIVTGYSTVLLWRNTISRCSNAIEPNRALLHHRNVRVIDLFFARLLLEIVGASTSLLLLSCLLCFTGLMMPPDDIFKMIVAWLLLAWFSMAMGLTIGSLSTRWDPVDRIWHVIAYLFLPVSGAFFMVDWLPSRLQEAAVLVPTVSCIELLREGYFGKTMHAHYELGYVVVLNTVLTLIALFSVRVGLRHGGRRMSRLHGVIKRYNTRSGKHTVLNGIDLDVKKGDKLGILGRNGAGKST